jgi:glutaredoxin
MSGSLSLRPLRAGLPLAGVSLAVLGRIAVLALVAGVLAPLPACKKAVPEAPPPTARTLPALEVTSAGKWLYTYADETGRFVTTDDVGKVPPTARRMVRVIDPAGKAAERTDLVSVYVVDLDELAKKGKVPARSLSREAFETAALLQLPPGESSPFPHQGAPAAVPGGGAAAPEAAPALPPGGVASVTVYGASWCGACKQARAFLRERNIPFADKDIERDEAAAKELREKASRLGVPADRIPIIDVRGRLLVGFDKIRLEALLGEAT